MGQRALAMPMRHRPTVRPCIAWSQIVFGALGTHFFTDDGSIVRTSVSMVVSSSGFDMLNPVNFVEARKHPGITTMFMTLNREGVR